MNYGSEIRDTLDAISKQHTMYWRILTKDDIVFPRKKLTKVERVANRLMDKVEVKLQDGAVGLYKGELRVYHCGKWKEVARHKNGKLRLAKDGA